MITLKIYNSDGTQYWSDVFFNSLEDCDAWIAVEQTRPYWDHARTFQKIASQDPAPAKPDPAVEQARQAARASLKSFDPAQANAHDNAQAIQNILIAMGLK